MVQSRPNNLVAAHDELVENKVVACGGHAPHDGAVSGEPNVVLLGNRAVERPALDLWIVELSITDRIAPLRACDVRLVVFNHPVEDVDWKDNLEVQLPPRADAKLHDLAVQVVECDDWLGPQRREKALEEALRWK